MKIEKRIDIVKLVNAIKEREEKQKKYKSLRPAIAAYYEKVYAWCDARCRDKDKAGPKPEKPENIRDVYDIGDVLTRLYSLRSHLRGKLHMTKRRLDDLYGWKGEIIDETRHIVKWTLDDQYKMVECLIDEYALEPAQKYVTKSVQSQVQIPA